MQWAAMRDLGDQSQRVGVLSHESFRHLVIASTIQSLND